MVNDTDQPVVSVWYEGFRVGKRQKISNGGHSDNFPKPKTGTTGAVRKRNFKSPIKVNRDES